LYHTTFFVRRYQESATLNHGVNSLYAMQRYSSLQCKFFRQLSTISTTLVAWAHSTIKEIHMEPTKTSSSNSGLVTGLFRDRDSAERAYQSISDLGYDHKDVNLVMSDETRKKHFSGDSAKTELGSKAAEGAGIGGAIGGTLGAIAAAVAAVGTSIAIPGLGLVVAGPLAAALAGAGAGGVTGGLVGALIGWGIPEERVRQYESGIKEGGILMGVKPRSEVDAQRFEQEWKNSRGEHVYR
jgi:hypothetical protein